MPSIMQHIGTPNERHNKDAKYRAKLENVDPALTQYNEVLREKSVEAIYAEQLQPAFDAFNERQKRKDRRLDVKWGVSSALELQRAMDEKARASKNAIDQKGRPPIREIVWQIGNPQQGYGCANQTPEHREKVKQMLLECQAEAERRYPQLAWGDLVFHADEVSQDAEDEEHGSLHLHSEFVPLCFQNKQGPDVQVAMERCLKEMGFSTFQEWKHDLDNIMEEVLHRHGLERTVMNNTEKHQESTEFHRQQRVIRQTRELEAQKAQAEQQAKELQLQLGAVQDQVSEAEKAAVFQNQLADAEAQRAEEARQRALNADAQADAAAKRTKALEGKIGALGPKLKEQTALYEELHRVNAANVKIIDENAAIIQEQEATLGLIQDYEEYCAVADLTDADLELGERMLQKLPAPKGVFKTAEQKDWLRDMKTMFEKLLFAIGEGIRRLRIFESRHEVPEKRSEPAQERAVAFEDKLADAFARAEEGSSKGHRSRQKDGPSLG